MSDLNAVMASGVAIAAALVAMVWLSPMALRRVAARLLARAEAIEHTAVQYGYWKDQFGVKEVRNDA